jgi:protein gp37
MATGISWANETLNPWKARLKSDPSVVGTVCVKVAAGCTNCYASELNESQRWNRGTGLAFTAPNLDLLEPFFDEEVARRPLNWGTPKSIFWGSMTDGIGEFQRIDWFARSVAVAALSPEHQHLFLTKRPTRLVGMLSAGNAGFWESAAAAGTEMGGPGVWRRNPGSMAWPTTNTWLGCSVANQGDWDFAEPYMKALRAAGWRTWVSYEPAIGPVDFRLGQEFSPLRIIVGGESGAKRVARWFDMRWAHQTVEQARGISTQVRVKQLGRNPYDGNEGLRCDGQPHEWAWLGLKHPHGAKPEEWPEDLRSLVCSPEMWR